jgi:SagB-type dehydrogenase family enzyme
MIGLCASIVKLNNPIINIISMSNNNDIEIAWNYHEATKHSYTSVRTNPHSLDFKNQPLPFKIYPQLELLHMPSEVRQTGIAALSAISGSAPTQTDAVPDLEAVAQLLYLSAGITRQRKYSGGEIYFRAAACTGALYEIELYLVCGDLPQLPAGIYHFAPAEFGLRRLRAGDSSAVLLEATGGNPAIAQAPMTIVCTGIYWRNAWKYQARTYRHFGWDNGTLLANLLAVATAMGYPAKIACGFVDATLNRLLDLDSDREVAFSLVAVGQLSRPLSRTTSQTMPESAEIPLLGFETVPLSANEVDYPVMHEMHGGSSLESFAEVAAWRPAADPERPEPGSSAMTQSALTHKGAPASVPPTGLTIPLQPLSDAEIPRDPIEQVILRRGSSRQFARTPINCAQLSTMLDRAARGVPADFLASKGTDADGDQLAATQLNGAQLNDLYLIVHAVDGLEAGAYFYRRDAGALECLKQGDFRDQAGYLGLEQQLPADAAVDIFFLADLRRIFSRFGNRGYRAVQLEAGVIGGRLYLAAYSQRLGATGLTFYDDDVTRFFSPHAEGKSAIFLVAVGHSFKRRPGQ